MEVIYKTYKLQRRKYNLIILKSEVLDFLCYYIFENERRKQRDTTLPILVNGLIIKI